MNFDEKWNELRTGLSYVNSMIREHLLLYKLCLLFIIMSVISIGYISNYSDILTTGPNQSKWFKHNILTVSEKAMENSNRLEHMQYMCQYMKNRVAKAQYKNFDIAIYTVDWKTTFCVIPKSGCSFQKQLIIYLNDPRSFIQGFGAQASLAVDLIQQIQASVFNISRQSVHALFFSPVTLTMDQFIKSSSLKVITARNPYSRLYSAYIDKFYIPVFNEMVEDYIVEIRQRNKYPFRTSETNYSSCFTKYLSFEEFLQVILLASSSGLGNNHWLPVSTLCEPCNVNPDIIVKQENYHDDMQYVLSQMDLNQSQKDTIQSVFGRNNIHSDKILHGVIETMLKRGLEVMDNCFTKFEMVERVWEALKVQGQIYANLKFPYSMLNNVEYLSESEIANVFMAETHKYKITKEESQQQRQRSLARAYRHIRKDVIIQIQAMYYYDFMLFDYDLNLPS